MNEVYLIDGIRTPIGRYAGALSSVRADDLGAVPIAALLARQSQLEPAAIDDVCLGCANQAGEDNRNVARMSLLLAGLPPSVPGSTLNRLCGSGLDAIGTVARGIRAGELDLAIAGGVESMSRAPWVMGKADSAFARTQQLEDTTMGWRFINPRLQAVYGTELMGETAENVAQRYAIAREDQDAFALRSQQRVAAAQAAGFFDAEIAPVAVAGRKGGDASTVEHDEAPRPNTTAEMLAKLAGVPPARHRHGRQRLRSQRWRRRLAAGLCAGRADASADAARAGIGVRLGGRGAGVHGHRPGAGRPAPDGALAPAHRAVRRDRTQ